jgi:endonuclease/exonuclease/phosphatase family metal-dependent hydrolase
MPTMHDQPPAAVQADLENLRNHLDSVVPAKQAGSNLLIATWNLRSFGSLTRKWTASSHDSPKRDLRGLLAIGEIVSRFDVVAIQEAKGDLRSLRDMMKWLGDNWAFLMTDITLGSAGNSERMVYIFERTHVRPSGLACELVVPHEWLDEIGADALQRQFARTPYAVSFQAANTTFVLVTLHVDYGDNSADRIPELKGIARWMRDWANRSNAWSHNLIALGDFNIDRQGDALWDAFTSTGLKAPDDLNAIPRTIFADPDNPQKEKYYDQIAWFHTSENAPKLSMPYNESGFVNFLPYVYTNTNLTKTSLSYRISDHYPLWSEFSLN